MANFQVIVIQIYGSTAGGRGRVYLDGDIVYIELGNMSLMFLFQLLFRNLYLFSSKKNTSEILIMYGKKN